MIEQGVVVEVTEKAAGSPLAADAAVSATSITVIDASDFDEAGGELRIGERDYLYTAVNMATDTITLDPTTPLLAAVTVDDVAEVLPLAPDVRALVRVADGGDALDCRVPHALAPLLPVGIREPDAQESVTISSSGTTWAIDNIVGRPAVVQGEAVDVSTLAPVENVSPDYTYQGNISMTQVDGGIIASVFRTEDVGTGFAQLGYNGLQSLRSDGSARFDLPNSDERAINIDAEIVARDFTSLGGFALRGTNNEIAKDAVFTLQRGTTQPVTPPSVSIGWDYITVEDALGLGDRWYGLAKVDVNWFRAFYLRPVSATVSGGIIERINAAGNVTANFAVTVDPLGGVTYLGTNLYVLGKRVTGKFGETRRWFVEIYNTSGVKQGEWMLSSSDFTYVPAIGNDGTNLLFSVHPSSGPLQIQPRNPSTGAVVGSVITTNVTFPRDSAAIMGGTFDFGVTRYVWVPRQPSGTATARVFSTAGTEQTAEQFPAAEGARVAGMTWDGTNFRSLGQGTPRLHTYTGIRNTAPPWWVANTWRRADATGPDFAQYETKLGAPRKFTMTRRASVIVNTAPIPSGAGGPEAADSMTLYFGAGASQPTNANMFRRSTPAVGVTAVQFTAMDFTGGAAPVLGNFPNANPAVIASDDPALLRISGDGSVTAPKKMQAGSVTVAMGGLIGATATVTFPLPFDVTPVVVATSLSALYVTTISSSSPTAVTIGARHKDEAATSTNVTVNWIAMVP